MPVFNGGMYQVWTVATDFLNDDMRVLLVDDAYVNDRDFVFVADVAANEIATTNYVRKVLAGKTITQDDINDRVLVDATDPLWVNLGPPVGGPIAQGIIMFRQVTNDADSPLIGFNELTTAPPGTQVNGRNFEIQWDPSGIVENTSP